MIEISVYWYSVLIAVIFALSGFIVGVMVRVLRL